MSDDYDICDLPCPACGNSFTHSRDCSAFNCEDGWIDESHDDPINFAPGEEFSRCQQCHGHGIERWCPACGADYWLAKNKAMKSGAIKKCTACLGSGNSSHGECKSCYGVGWVRVPSAV